MSPKQHRDLARKHVRDVLAGYHTEKNATIAIMHMMAAEMEEKEEAKKPKWKQPAGEWGLG
jgi:hypothetical protein